MENKNISQIVIDRIRGEGLKPISKKVFNLKRISFWVAVAICLFVGAFMFSLVVSGLLNNDWDLYDRFGVNFVFRTLPYFWFVSLIIFIILGEYYYRKTMFGYRHTIIVVVGAYMASSIIFGSIFYAIGVSDLMENDLVGIPTVYRNIILNRHEVWTHPEKGLLSGKIIQLDEGSMQSIDNDGSVWDVDINSLSDRDDLNLKVGDRMKITGDIMDDNFFIAEEIRPW